MTTTCVFSPSKQIVPFNLPIGKQYIFIDNVSKFTNEYSNLIWISNNVVLEKELIESCCMLKELTIFHNGSEDEVLNQWLSELENVQYTVNNYGLLNSDPDGGVTYSLDIIKNVISEIKKVDADHFVVSSMCFHDYKKESLISLVNAGVKFINVANASNLHKHNISVLKSLLDEVGLATKLMNGLFYKRSENIFENDILFVEQFRKMIHFATILNASHILYGSSNSKNVTTPISKQYVAYTSAHTRFAGIFRVLSNINKEITIIVKPNIGNYLFTEEQVVAMVNEIDCVNVQAGDMRKGILSSFHDFDLLEYDGSCFEDPLGTFLMFLGYLFR